MSDWAAGVVKHWPLLVVLIWRPPCAGLEELGWQHCDTKLYEAGSTSGMTESLL
jgi:hypothetical protein